MRRILSTAICGLSVISAPSQAACWNREEIAAAKVRDLDTMLMVSGLRCRFENAALLQTYNAMVVRHRLALTQANAILGTHFSAAAGGADELDRYITRVANRYGAGAERLSCASLQSLANATLNEPTTLAALEAFADRAAVQPELPGGTCEAPEYQLAVLR